MFIIKNTKKIAGVCICGDFNDLKAFFEALQAITISEFSKKNTDYIDISTRILGLRYDVRHAMQGDREIELVKNGINEAIMKFQSIIAPKKNVYYKFNYLYPEMFFVMIALNELVKLRIKELAKLKEVSDNAFNKNVIWDEKISVIRSFQSAFQKCVRTLLTEASFNRWLKVVNKDYIAIHQIAGQYLDLLNIKYINMSREERINNLTKIASRIAAFKFDEEHNEIKKVVTEAAKEYGCRESDICLEGINYPDDIEW